MYAEVEDLLRQAKTKDQVHHILQRLCEPHGAVVKTDVLCGEVAPRQVMCMIQMAEPPAATSVAGRIGAMTYGNRLVIVRYQAPDDFVPR